MYFNGFCYTFETFYHKHHYYDRRKCNVSFWIHVWEKQTNVISNENFMLVWHKSTYLMILSVYFLRQMYLKCVIYRYVDLILFHVRQIWFFFIKIFFSLRWTLSQFIMELIELNLFVVINDHKRNLFEVMSCKTYQNYQKKLILIKCVKD